MLLRYGSERDSVIEDVGYRGLVPFLGVFMLCDPGFGRLFGMSSGLNRGEF